MFWLHVYYNILSHSFHSVEFLTLHQLTIADRDISQREDRVCNISVCVASHG